MMKRVISLTLPAVMAIASAAAAGEVDGWPAGVQEVSYRSTGDDSDQPALMYLAPTPEPAPLLVGLHVWSTDYRGGADGPKYAQWCIDNGWHFIHPDMRGPNNHPDSTGSELVIADVLSAVAYARQQAEVDADRIYLVGVSGGGFDALLMAGHAPRMWAGVSAWVPITDLRAWYAETKAADRRYWRDIEASCGGPPGASEEVDRAYRERSPLTHLARARGLAIDINAGIHDGHTGSVPISHSLRAFNVVADPDDAISEAAIEQMVDDRAVPEALQFSGEDETYGSKPVLLRRTSGPARVTIFEGGHEIVVEAAMSWLARQRRDE